MVVCGVDRSIDRLVDQTHPNHPVQESASQPMNGYGEALVGGVDHMHTYQCTTSGGWRCGGGVVGARALIDWLYLLIHH
jgi:hypothetical protein